MFYFLDLLGTFAFAKISADKKAEDATTVKELIEMYNQQGKK